MEYDDHIEKKIEERLQRFVREYQLREKDSDEREIVEEVFDQTTLMNLYHLMN